jgi:hypothetical protein
MVAPPRCSLSLSKWYPTWLMNVDQDLTLVMLVVIEYSAGRKKAAFLCLAQIAKSSPLLPCESCHGGPDMGIAAANLVGALDNRRIRVPGNLTQSGEPLRDAWSRNRGLDTPVDPRIWP